MGTTVIIKNLDGTTMNWITDKARERGMSVEDVILQMLHETIGLEQKNSQPKQYHDLDSLAGTWSKEEHDEFVQAIADLDQVDEQLWQ